MIVLNLFALSQPATCETFHIIPSADSLCPGRLTGEPCITLSQYISGVYRQYTSDPSEIILVFQPGRHTYTNYNLNTFASQLVSFKMNSMNSTVIDCNHSPRYVRITNIKNVLISGINFIRCNYRIESVMNFTLEKSSFSRVQHNAYALYIGSSSAMIKASIFMNNNLVALHIYNSSIFIDYSNFINNRVRRSIASVQIVNENSYHKNVTIFNSDFSRNSGEYSNTRRNDAGALSVFASYLELYNTTFVGNRGRNGGALAIQNTQCMVIISQCKFIDNGAIIRGGAIFTSSSITLQQSTIDSNTAQTSYPAFGGGAIYVTGNNIYVSIQLCRFMSNEVAAGAGGAVYIVGSNNSLSISQSNFISNRINRVESKGGAVFVTGTSNRILLEKSSISNNQALTGSGGAIYINGQNTYTLITESIVNHNLAAYCGALVINDSQLNNVNFKNSIFINNSAISRSGGVMCVRNASISLQNVTFSHNRAAANGGVFTVDDSKMTICGSTFYNNTAEANGGVLNTEYFRISLLISHTSFTNNHGDKLGGVMYLGRKGSQVKISRSEIHSNNATRGGFATILGSSLEISTSSVFNNTAETGEIISACNSDILVSDQLFTATDPVYSVCTLISGDINDTYDFEVTTTTTEALTNTTATTHIPTTTSRPTPETTTMSTTISQPTEPSIILSVHFELNGKVYPNNSVISLSNVGENEHALLCKTNLMTCCATLPNRFGEFYYPNAGTVSVKKAGYGFYRDRGAQVVRLNRREGVTSPSGKFRCAVPDASGTIQNLFVHLQLTE